MPELPEVEILRRHLETHIVGSRIRKVNIFKKRIVRPDAVSELKSIVAGRLILGIDRRGKYLLVKLGPESDSIQLLIHLGMTGRLYWADKSGDAYREKHLAILLECDRGNLCYVDSRTFGRWSLDLSSIETMGPEPLDSTSFHVRYLKEKFRNRKTKVKDFLMNQSNVAGLGNIYVCEALHAAGIHPLQQVGLINGDEMNKLIRSIRKVLRSALKIGESSQLNLHNAETGDGFFYFGRSGKSDRVIQERFRVYDREGKPCRDCESPVERIVMAQRSTYFCPDCQSI